MRRPIDHLYRGAERAPNAIAIAGPGEPVSYGNPYGESFLQRLKRMFGGR